MKLSSRGLHAVTARKCCALTPGAKDKRLTYQLSPHLIVEHPGRGRWTQVSPAREVLGDQKRKAGLGGVGGGGEKGWGLFDLQ